MLGVYENFPENIHKTVHFTASISNKKLQQTLIQMLHRINSEKFNLEDVANPSVPECTVIFEFGIAETNNFNYLDKEETSKVLKAAQRKPFQIMDFYCDMRYYKIQNEQKNPLKFDYYMMRFTFEKDLISMQVFHERGPRYLLPEDVTNFVINKINEAFPKKMLKILKSS